MKLLFLVLTLLPFFHDEKYEVQYQSCKDETIVINYQQQEYELKLFNINYTNELSHAKACNLLQEANTIEIEIDPLIKIEKPFNAYVFVDGLLVQEHLIKQELAVPKINHPNYKYSKQMQLQQSVATNISKAKTIQKSQHGYIHIIIYYLLLLLSICIYKKIKV